MERQHIAGNISQRISKTLAVDRPNVQNVGKSNDGHLRCGYPKTETEPSHPENRRKQDEHCHVPSGSAQLANHSEAALAKDNQFPNSLD